MPANQHGVRELLEIHFVHYPCNLVDYVTLLYHLHLACIIYIQVYNAKENPSLL